VGKSEGIAGSDGLAVGNQHTEGIIKFLPSRSIVSPMNVFTIEPGYPQTAVENLANDFDQVTPILQGCEPVQRIRANANRLESATTESTCPR